MTPLKIIILLLWVGSIVLSILAGSYLDPVLWALWCLGAGPALGGIIPGP